MIRKDDTDVTWLIYADYLEEIGENIQAEEIRYSTARDIIEGIGYNIWVYEYASNIGYSVGSAAGVGGSVGGVGDEDIGSISGSGATGVGGNYSTGVGIDGVGGNYSTGVGIDAGGSVGNGPGNDIINT
jgi:uncharacterized protein (TIGR02996 family)